MKLFITKIVEKSPLKYSIVKGLSCFDPLVAQDKNLAEKRISIVLEKFIDSNLLSALQAEKIAREYKQIISFRSSQEKLKSFNKEKERLDNLRVNIINLHENDNFKNLFDFIKRTMILSHGNAALERGFSINQECVSENLKEKSLIAQRIIICDAINAMDQPLTDFVIDKQLIQHVRMSSSLYRESLAKEKENKEKEDEKRRNQQRFSVALQELEDKKEKVMDEALTETARLETQITALKNS